MVIGVSSLRYVGIQREKQVTKRVSTVKISEILVVIEFIDIILFRRLYRPVTNPACKCSFVFCIQYLLNVQPGCAENML